MAIPLNVKWSKSRWEKITSLERLKHRDSPIAISTQNQTCIERKSKISCDFRSPSADNKKILQERKKERKKKSPSKQEYICRRCFWGLLKIESITSSTIEKYRPPLSDVHRYRSNSLFTYKLVSILEKKPTTGLKWRHFTT